MNTVCISTKMYTPEKVGGQNTGRPSTSKSRGKCPPVHPRVYAHVSQSVASHHVTYSGWWHTRLLLRNKSLNRDQLYFSATCCGNAERWLVNSCLRLVVFVGNTWSSALCVNRNCCYFLQLFDFLNLVYSLLNCFIDLYGVDGIKNWVHEVGCGKHLVSYTVRSTHVSRY